LLTKNAGLLPNSKINNVPLALMRAVNATKNLGMVKDPRVKMHLLSQPREKTFSRVQIKNRLKSPWLHKARLCEEK
jgi:hypothetical protein